MLNDTRASKLSSKHSFGRIRLVRELVAGRLEVRSFWESVQECRECEAAGRKDKGGCGTGEGHRRWGFERFWAMVRARVAGEGAKGRWE